MDDRVCGLKLAVYTHSLRDGIGVDVFCHLGVIECRIGDHVAGAVVGQKMGLVIGRHRQHLVFERIFHHSGKGDGNFFHNACVFGMLPVVYECERMEE